MILTPSMLTDAARVASEGPQLPLQVSRGNKHAFDAVVDAMQDPMRAVVLINHPDLSRACDVREAGRSMRGAA